MILRRTAFLFAFLLASCAAFAQDGVSFTTEDRWNISALYRPSENGKVVILLHDLGRRKEDFPTFSSKLAEAGFGYLAVDLRGHGKTTNRDVQKNFKKTGVDNEFNQMVRDVTASIKYLNDKGISTGNIYIVGAGLGANVAARSLVFNPNLGGVALLTPSLKSRDVLTISGIRVYKNPVFIGVSSQDRKQFMEASFIRNAAYLSSGEGKVTFVTAYNLSGVDMLDRYLTPTLLQWLQTPKLPEVLPDNIDEEIVLPAPSALSEAAQG